MITAKTEKHPADQLVASAPAKKRRMCFVVWNFHPLPEAIFRTLVDGAKERGFTTIRLHIAWFNAERRPQRYEFALYDKQIEYIRKKGMDVILTIDLQRKAHTFDGVRVPTDTVITTDEFQYPYGKNTPFLPTSMCDTLMISFASRKGTALAVRFYRDAVRHFVGKYGSLITAVSPTFTPFCETEYWCEKEFDYSPHMRRAFHAFLAKTYRRVKDLNLDLGTSYENFTDVPLPSCDNKSAVGVLFYQCRHQYLKDFIDRLADAQRDTAPRTAFSVQFGSVWDSASARRCTFGFSELAEHAQLVMVDDGPSYNHAFSMDLLASAFAGTDKEFGNEIDGYSLIENGRCDADTYAEQGLSSFRHNASVLYVANWQNAFDHFCDNGYIFTTIADEYLNKKNPDCVAETHKTEQPLEISTFRMFERADDDYYTGYYQIYTADGNTFGRISVKDDLIHCVMPHSIAGKKRKKAKKLSNPASPAVVVRKKAAAAIGATAAVGAAILILSVDAAGMILKAQPQDETDD